MRIWVVVRERDFRGAFTCADWVGELGEGMRYTRTSFSRCFQDCIARRANAGMGERLEFEARCGLLLVLEWQYESSLDGDPGVAGPT